MTFEEIVNHIGIKPYYQDEWCVIYHADCRDILPLIPDKSIDLVLTDPPYNVGKNYGGENLSHDEMAAFYSDWMCLTRQTMIEGASIYCCSSQSWLGQVWLWFRVIYKFIRLIIWYAENAAGVMNPYFYYHWQPLLFGCKGDNPAVFNRQNAITGRDVWEANVLTSRTDPCTAVHPTRKPVKLMDNAILISSNRQQIILDPFLGSGTTCYCAKKLNRYSIGIEIEEKYCEIAAKRCSQSVMRLEV